MMRTMIGHFPIGPRVTVYSVRFKVQVQESERSKSNLKYLKKRRGDDLPVC